MGSHLYVCRDVGNGHNRRNQQGKIAVGWAMKIVLPVQLLCFVLIGSMIVHHERAEAKMEAQAAMLVQLPLKALMEVRI